jgi:autotransporter-associated beta strand protein
LREISSCFPGCRIVLLALALPGASFAGNYVVTSNADTGAAGTLRWAINQANADTGSTIAFDPGLDPVVLQSALPMITAAVTINGGAGATISGNNLHRVFFVNTASATDAVKFQNLTIADGYAKGGDGGRSGGGGMGAGGAIFVNTGAVSVSGITLRGNAVQGGNGGNGATGETPSSGGGGGLAGNGGDGSRWAGGGGGGRVGDGGAGADYPGGIGGAGGGPNGGAGAVGDGHAGGNGGIGGGGGGSSARTGPDYAYPGGNGGDFGGGGGTPGGGSQAGSGGYGGGGGGGSALLAEGQGGAGGGNGGFGGGGGGSPTYTLVSGGAYGGSGGTYEIVNWRGEIPGSAAGGGGAALGGAIFVRSYSGASLEFLSGTETASTATGGLAGISMAAPVGTTLTEATNGSGAGSGIFLSAGDSNFSGGTFAGEIAGDSGANMRKVGDGTLMILGTLRADSTITAGAISIGNGGTTGSLSGNVTNNAALIFNRSDNGLVYSGSLTGTGAVTKIGAGTVTFAGNNSLYTGSITIDEGVLALNGGGNPNNRVLDTTINAGGTLRLLDHNQIGTSTITVNGGTFDFNGKTDYFASLVMKNGGTVSGGGRFTLESIGSSLLSATGGGNAGTIATTFGITSQFGIGGDADRTVQIDIAAATSLTISGTIRDTLEGSTRVGSVNKTGDGTLLLTGDNTYTGGTTLTGGTLALGSAGAIGSTGAITFAGGALQLTAANTADHSARFSTAASQQYRIDTNGQSGVLGTALASSGGTFEKLGAGTLTLTGSNTYTGGTTISAGTLQLGNGGTTGSILGNVTNNGTLAFNRSDSFTAANLISGTGAVTKLGSGTLTLANNNTYTGATTISDGTVVIGGTGASSSHTIASGAVLEFNLASGSRDQGADTVVSGGGTLVKSGASTLSWGAGATTFQMASGSLIDVQGGTLVGGSNANEVWSANLSDLNVAAGARFWGAEANARVNALTGSGAIHSGLSGAGYTAFTFGVDNGSGIFAGVLADTNAASGHIGNFTKAGTGTQILTGTSTYTGGTMIAAGTLQLGNGGTTGSILGNVTNNGTLAFNRSDSFAYANLINGSGSVTKLGDGTLTFTTAQTYSGGTTISAGTLQLGASERLADNGAVTINGGTLALGSFNETIGNFTISSGAITGTGTLTASSFAVAGPGTISAVLAGSGALTQSGAGTTTLTGANTYTGGTTISAGTLQLGNGGTTGSILGNVTNNGTLAFNRSDSFAYANVISGTGSVIKLGDGTLAFTTAQTYTGGTTISAGTLALDASDRLANTGAVTINGGTLAFGSLNLTMGAFTFSSGAVTGTGSLTASSFALIDTGTLGTFANVLAGSGALTKSGAGTTTLTGANTYTGETTISAGTLQLGNGGTTGSILGNVTNNGTLAFNRSDSFAYANLISGTGSVTKLGEGTLSFTAAQTYTGGTTISAGTLALDASERLADSGAVTINGGTLALGSFDETVGNFTLSSGAITGTGTLTASSFAIASPATISVVLAGGGALTKSGAGTTTLIGVNTYTGGTTISAGTLQIGSGGNTGSITGNIINNGTLIFNRSGALSHDGSLSGTGSLTKLGDGTLTLMGNNSFTGSTTVGAGVLALSGVGDSSRVFNTTINAGGTLRLLYHNQIGTSTITVNGGTLDFNGNIDYFASLVLSNGGTVGGGGAFTLETTGTSLLSAVGGGNAGTISSNIGITSQHGVGGGNARTLQVDIATATRLTISGAIRDTLEGATHVGSLFKTGTGTLMLTGANTYTGVTAVFAGTLLVNGSLANTVTVLAGGTLGGSGSIGGPATFQSGAHLAAGNSPGTITFTNGLVLEDGAILDFELGTFSDKIVVSGGTLSADGTVTVNLFDSGGFTAGTYTLIDATGATLSSIGATSFELGTVIAGYTYVFSQNGGEILLSASAIPEPSACAVLAGIGVIAFVMIRRRRA